MSNEKQRRLSKGHGKLKEKKLQTFPEIFIVYSKKKLLHKINKEIFLKINTKRNANLMLASWKVGEKSV